MIFLRTTISLDQWFLTCGEFPTVGEWRTCQVGMTGRTIEPLLQNLTHHIQMLAYFTNHNHLHWEMESWPNKKWGIGEKRLLTPGLDPQRFG